MWTLFSIILLEGFVSISIEILAIRQMIPFVGNSVIVTSIIIGIFLLFLALGYRKGGTYTQNYKTILLDNFTKAIFWIGIGMSPVFIYLYFLLMNRYISQLALFNLSLYLLIVTAPIIYILGQTLPISTNLFRREHTIGAISGKALFLSTVGSFFGAILTTLILFNYIGVAWTVFFNISLLTCLILLLQYYHNIDYSRILILAGALLLSFVLNVSAEQMMFLKTNNYANYQVIEPYVYNKNNIDKAFIINNSLSSFINDKHQAAPYIETIKKILFNDLNIKNKKVLVLGAGGFTLTANGTHNNDVIYVDIDPDIQKLVKSYFLSPIHGKFVADDARQYVKKFPASYDVIISDAYSNRVTIPMHLLTQEHMRNLSNALKENGIAIFNIIANPQQNDSFSIRIDNTINSIFPNCMKIPLQYWNKVSNIIYVCKKTLRKRDQMVYRDDLNRSTIDYFMTK